MALAIARRLLRKVTCCSASGNKLVREGNDVIIKDASRKLPRRNWKDSLRVVYEHHGNADIGKEINLQKPVLVCKKN